MGVIGSLASAVTTAAEGVITQRLKALLGVSSFEKLRPGYGPSDKAIEAVRKSVGGNISPMPNTLTRLYQSDLEAAQVAADCGNLETAGQIYRSMRRDGVIAGLLSTRTDGLVRLPRRFFGDTSQTKLLDSHDGTPSIFDQMMPSSELALLAADGICLGVGVGELVPVEGRAYPVLRRLDPSALSYRWAEGCWYFRSIAGMIPIEPGLGRWVLHIPGGRVAPWQHGLWMPLGRAYITKDHALTMRANWLAKFATPARVGISPTASTEEQNIGFLERLIAWSMNASFILPPGYDIKLIEAKGEGYQGFKQAVDDADHEIIIALAGQEVTTTGGTGFANADIHRSIRADLIKATADALAATVNTQILPPWVIANFGIEALDTRAIVEWDTSQPRDLKAEADSMVSTATAITQLRAALLPYGQDIDVIALCNRFGIPMLGSPTVSVANEPVEAQSGTVSVIPAPALEATGTDDVEPAPATMRSVRSV